MLQTMNRFQTLAAATAAATVPLLGDSQPESMPGASIFQRGHEMKATDLPAGYNASARIDTQKTWEFFVSGSFIYWMPMQDAMDVSVSNASNAPAAPQLFVPNLHAELKDFHFHYEPGFKAAFGMHVLHDNWTALVQVTHLTVDERTEAHRPSSSSYLYSLTAPPTTGLQEFEQKNSWDMQFNMVDVNLNRAYYVGASLTFQPFIGVRAGKIHQHLHTHADAFFNAANPSVEFDTSYRTNTWLVGPRVGMDANLLLGKGVRMFGTMAGALCYNNSKTRVRQEIETFDAPLFSVKDVIREIKPNGEIDLGFGYGTYFNNHKSHFDISASYDFNIFWNQNMMSYLKDQIGLDAGGSPGNLYLHGLTAKMQFNF